MNCDETTSKTIEQLGYTTISLDPPYYESSKTTPIQIIFDVDVGRTQSK